MQVKIIFFSLFLSCNFLALSQSTTAVPLCTDQKFEKEVHNYLNQTVPIISCEELSENLSDYVVLDSRELAEYQISHINNAVHVGYDTPNFDALKDLSVDTPIVVYCSIGYRSEKIGEQLNDLGFTNVKNLFGSIFEWVNQDKAVYNPKGLEVKEVHTYNKKWSKWVTNDEILKTYE